MFGKAPFFPHQGRNGIWTSCHIPHTQHKASSSRRLLNTCRVNEWSMIQFSPRPLTSLVLPALSKLPEKDLCQRCPR